MKTKYKVFLIIITLILLGKTGWRIYRETNADVKVLNVNSIDESFYYNGHTYVNFSCFVDDRIGEGVLLEGAHSDDPEPYKIMTQALVRKYVKGYGSQHEKMHGPTIYVEIDKSDKDNMLMFLLGDEMRYIREDFVFPTVKKDTVEAIILDNNYENRLTDKQTIADFIDAIYEKGEATDKISEYLDKEYNTHIYFKYEGCDCAIEFIGRFSIEDGEFTMYEDITDW